MSLLKNLRAISKFSPRFPKRDSKTEFGQEEIANPSHSPPLDDVSQLQRKLEEASALRSTLLADLMEQQRIYEEDESSVKRLPNELLIDIFELVLFADSQQILTLRLVRRAWYRLVQATHRLWATVTIKVPSEWVALERCINYCTLCIQNSGDAPLDIQLDYMNIKSMEQMDYPSTLTQVTQDLELPNANGIGKWIWGHSYMKGIRDRASRRSFYTPLVVFAGNDHSRMARWRHFGLAVSIIWEPDMDRPASILERLLYGPYLQGPTPALETFTLTYLNDGVNTAMGWSGKSEWKKPSHAELAIRDLKFTNLVGHFGYFPTNPARMTSLDISLGGFAPTIKYVYGCCNLTELRIRMLPGEDRLEWSYKLKVPSIHFPKLRLLRLHQKHPHGFLYSLEAPRLEVIIFEDPISLRCVNGFPTLPSFRRMELPWTRKLSVLGPRTELNFATDIFHEIFKASPLLETFIVSGAFSTQFSSILESFESKGVDFSPRCTTPYTPISNSYHVLTEEFTRKIRVPLQHFAEVLPHKNSKERLTNIYSDNETKNSHEAEEITRPLPELPSELLIDIFEIVLFTDSQQILTLRLVRRSWYHLIQATSRLWATITIKVPLGQVSFERCIDYCMICVRNSGDALLDIHLDYTNIGGMKQMRYLPTLIWATQDLELLDAHRVGNWIWGYSYAKGIRNLRSHRAYYTPLVVFAGNDNRIMARWRHFGLALSTSWDADRDRLTSPLERLLQGQYLQGSTPVLETFTLTHLDDGTGIMSGWSGKSEWRKPRHTELSIRDLQLINLVGHFGHFPTDPAHMTSLDISLRKFDTTMRYIYGCCNLTELRICMTPGEESLEWSYKLRIPLLDFPKLRLLRLHHEHPRGFLYSLDAPRLEAIIFEDPMSLRHVNGFPTFPSFRRLELPWTRQLSVMGPRTELDFVMGIFHEIFEASPLLETFIVSSVFSAQFSNILESFRSKDVVGRKWIDTTLSKLSIFKQRSK
ncbi:hypothetical protein M408DRAFT_24577 [Serendipita vermifera MAFF 305830]|uniref:F-box domain-containing protein n=1 Tax=Serendipita vermifera MAFF 305830 TaxID=933852 RepID=A0A0C2WM27_SERVB|nr:hypothetical protein M408DRAFT_24577 [Serendipita vermifera MAFF 305830]